MLSPRTTARLGLAAAFVLFASCMAVIGRGAAGGKWFPHRYVPDIQPAVVSPSLQPTGTPAPPLSRHDSQADSRLAKAR
jgi:hypothetical protein